MSFFSNLIETKYDFVWKSIIRPPRDNYKDQELGKKCFKLGDINFKRSDFNLYNKRNMKMFCSFWEPFDRERPAERMPVVVYLPGNSSSRCEAVPLLGFLLPMNIAVFAFDFCGSGRSDGEYISLGYHEKDDVQTVLNYLRGTNKVSTIGLWGRSMGGVTALLSAKENKDKNLINCIVCDSAFSSLSMLIDEFVDKVISLPGFLLNIMKGYVNEIIEKKAKFTIDKIEPIKVVKDIKNIPILFCHAMDDTFMDKHHTEDLFKVFQGDKHIVLFEGEHNSKRPLHILQVISLFFYEQLKVENIIELSLEYDNKKSMSKTISTQEYSLTMANTIDLEYDDLLESINDENFKQKKIKTRNSSHKKCRNYLEKTI